jgi:osomolarity two-component system, response regulator SSK1
MEWGCMQALIDYDGWRQWKDFSQDSRDDDSKDGKSKGFAGLAAGASGGRKKKHRISAGSSPSASTSHIPLKESNGTEPVGLGLGVDNSENSRSPNHAELGGER